MSQKQSGTNVPRGLTLTLNTPFVESLGEEGLRHYAAVVVEAAGRSHDLGEDDLTDLIVTSMAEHDVPVAEQSAQRIAEQLKGSDVDSLTIATDEGRVLYGDPGAADANATPDVHGSEDPDHPDRPAYS